MWSSTIGRCIISETSFRPLRTLDSGNWTASVISTMSVYAFPGHTVLRMSESRFGQTADLMSGLNFSNVGMELRCWIVSHRSCAALGIGRMKHWTYRSRKTYLLLAGLPGSYLHQFSYFHW